MTNRYDAMTVWLAAVTNTGGFVVQYAHDIMDRVTNISWRTTSGASLGGFAYEYDALGRRVSTTTVKGTTRHVYDNNWQVVADIDENGSVVTSYVWGEGIDKLLAVTIGGATYYPLTDIQGTVWGYVDSQNNIVTRWQYDAWGNVVDEEVAPSAAALVVLRYRFQGREWSAATGLINFRMRWYDAETGRWLSKDPIGLSGGLNLYLFCKCNPLVLMDAFGLVDLNLFLRTQLIHHYANRHNPSGVFSVGAHGNENGVAGISAQDLARRIQNAPGYHGQPVQLDSCNVGRGQYPQQLSDLLGAEVRAPTQFAWYYPSGAVIYAGRTATGRIDNNAPGVLRIFRPRRQRNTTGRGTR